MGGQRCKTCGHAKLPDIHRLRHVGATHEALAAEFDLSVSSLWRHFRDEHPVTGFAAVGCAPEAVQAAATIAGGVVASSRPAPVQAPFVRHRAIAGGARAQVLMNPGSPDPGGVVVPFVRPPPVVVEELQPEPVPLLKRIADLLELGFTHDDVGHQLSIGGEEMAGYIATIEEAKRTLLAKSPEDWGASLAYSCMSRLARYRRRQSELEAALRHKEADRFDDKIVAAERELRKLLTEFGLVGRLDRSVLERQVGGMDDIETIFRNISKGEFVDFRTPADKKQLRLG